MERVVVEERLVRPLVTGGLRRVVRVLDPTHQPVPVIPDPGDPVQRIADPGGLTGQVVGFEHRRRVTVGVLDLRDRARIRRTSQVEVVIGDRAGRIGDLV